MRYHNSDGFFLKDYGVMNSVELKVFAKLNLSLCITGVYDDGFHRVDTVLQSVDIFDELTVKKRADGHCEAYGIDVPENTALKAAELFVQTFKTGGADIYIKKGIPLSGGMGGSSADAAGVLAALSRLYGVPVSEVEPLAERLGSDVKFMLHGGRARATGRGETLEFLNHEKMHFVVLKPDFGLSTAEIYRQFDLAPNAESNALQAPALNFSTVLREFFEAASRVAEVTMTGSGSCFFAVCKDKDESAELCARFKAAGFDAAECKSVEKGVEFF